MISLIIFPPGPITSLILSGSMFIIAILGAYGLNCFLGSEIHANMLSKISRRALCACANASSKIFLVIPVTLISICKAVIPFFVPATLKSISPKWSSIPWISVKTVYLPELSSMINPIAIPATGALIGTPAAIRDIVPAQILA